MSNVLSDQVVADLLVAVGAEPGMGPAQFDTTFEDLDLDSLARAEFAARVKALTGVDVEERLACDTTPNGVRRLVLADLPASRPTARK